MTDYNNRLKDLSTQYKILISEFKEIYPLYQANPSDPEYEAIFNNLQTQIQNIFTMLEDIDIELENKNMKTDMLFNKANNDLNSRKKYYKNTKPKLQQVIDKNSGAEPREQELKIRLYYKYADFIYIILLLGSVFYSFSKLAK